MGSSDSNCCGSVIDEKYYIPDDPDSGTIGKKRRFQNTELPDLNRTNSFSQQSHSFEFRGNITISSNGADLNSVPYGITLNINGQNINTNNNANMMNTNMVNTNINDTNRNYGDINGLIDCNGPQKQQKQQKQDIKLPIINPINYIPYNHNDDDNDDYDENNNNTDDDEEDDEMESIISYLSSAIHPNAENEENEEKEEKDEKEDDKEESENDKYDLDNMQTLKLKENKVRNLLNSDQIENWDKKEIDQLEIEMLRELRRLSLT